MCGITDPAGCIADAARSGLEAMAGAMADAASWIITEAFTWWVDTDGGQLNTGVVDAVRQVTTPLTVSVAAAGMILLGIRMVLSGSPDPLLSVGEGIAKLVFWTVAGTAVITALMHAASGFSSWVLDDTGSRELGAKLLMAFHQPVEKNAGLILLLSLLGFLAGVVQWVLSFLREGAVAILAGCLQLAASGSLGLGHHWLSKITSWCLALIFWQPAAALVYFAAFGMLQHARGPEEMLVGLTMLVLAILTLPVLMKLFNWAISTSSAGGGNSSRLAGAALAYQLRGNARGGGRMSPGQHARLIDSSLPRHNGGTGSPPSGSTPGGGDRGSPGASPATSSGAVPGSRTPDQHSASAAPPREARAASGASGSSGAAGAPTAAGHSASGAGTGAAGAKAASAGGPVGAAAAAAAAAAMVGAAGVQAAGRAMTEGADTQPPPNTSRKDRS